MELESLAVLDGARDHLGHMIRGMQARDVHEVGALIVEVDSRCNTIGRRDDSAGRVEIKTALPAGVPILAAPFDNLKIGLPAAVRAATAARSSTAG